MEGVEAHLLQKLSENIQEDLAKIRDNIGGNTEEHYHYEARPESNHHPVTLPLATGNTLCQYLANRTEKPLTDNDKTKINSYKTNEYLGYVVKCNRIIAMNRVTDKKHVKYTIHRDRLALV